MFWADSLLITNSPGVNNAGTVSFDEIPALPPYAKVSILDGLSGDDPTYFNAVPGCKLEKKSLSKESNTLGSPILKACTSFPTTCPVLRSPPAFAKVLRFGRLSSSNPIWTFRIVVLSLGSTYSSILFLNWKFFKPSPRSTPWDFSKSGFKLSKLA